jgi:hypothetical protein
MAEETDFLDELIEEFTDEDSQFPVLLAAAQRRRQLLHDLVAERKRKRISQKTVADRMGTSQPAVARLEGQDDAKESMIDRYAAAIGVVVERQIQPQTKPARRRRRRTRQPIAA